MADKTAEQLSALMDCECEEQELELALRRLGRDTDLKARWQRYHLIGDALKNNLPETLTIHFAERVRTALDTETLPQTPSDPAAVPWYRQVTGFAAAASLALIVAVFALKQPAGPPETAAGGWLAAAPPAGAAASGDGALESRLSSYLVNHNEYASMNSVHGMLSYVRMVGYDTRR